MPNSKACANEEHSVRWEDEGAGEDATWDRVQRTVAPHQWIYQLAIPKRGHTLQQINMMLSEKSQAQKIHTA